MNSIHDEVGQKHLLNMQINSWKVKSPKPQEEWWLNQNQCSCRLYKWCNKLNLWQDRREGLGEICVWVCWIHDCLIVLLHVYLNHWTQKCKTQKTQRLDKNSDKVYWPQKVLQNIMKKNVPVATELRARQAGKKRQKEAGRCRFTRNDQTNIEWRTRTRKCFITLYQRWIYNTDLK